ncbi:RagB/SusD family nutrient uptake outer membrane protein [Mucilaginibacter sp. JRF]|uniref:RagB/SusD family nutrient uptake outer membrane protein n=1 Tax=Mucilaginibacter sp. JRF TaxID=2780088 RepID=UPI0018812B50|nr:RagB/SusD family nutrient uptake outer membrane protein [Mucilaginibacter sp. JRF]MBE9586137.1 RagB/SusD family nutrient uptake outer membrane protein [Mucilaginibacter sp. JRF]
MKKKISSIFVLLLLAASSCKDLTVAPTDAISTETLVTTTAGLTNALNGAYALFKDHITFNGTIDQNNMYLRQYYHLSDFASDDIVCGQVTTDPLFYSFSLGHAPSQGNTRYFWYVSYKIISGVNTVIDAVEKSGDQDAAKQQLLGECYFLRAFCHFNLVRLFGKPYSVDPNAPGIILRTSLTDEAKKARSTVGEVYTSVIADAEKAATLMTQNRGVQYASKEAAWALLSRVNLYKEDNQKAIDYANQVINSGRFTLTTATTYPSLFANATAGSETIFCVAFTAADDYGKFGSIASMIYSDGNSGWGEEYASSSLRTLMSKHTEDVRWSYIVPSTDGTGTVQKKNGIEMYYISKFSFQGGSPNLSSPIMFRLSEMYLNKAEAEAKLNQTSAALNDVDEIRKNRGLSGSLYAGTLPSGYTALDAVLEERRIELAFEGHRTYDVFRNKRTLNKTYWGYHLAGLKETDIDLSRTPSGYPNMTVPYTSNRIIYYIPVDEVLSNPQATQNP